MITAPCSTFQARPPSSSGPVAASARPAHKDSRHSARVVCADANGKAADATAGEIRSQEGEADALELDIADPDSVRTAVGRVGTPDVLVSTPSANVRKPVLEVSDEEFDRILELNLNRMEI